MNLEQAARELIRTVAQQDSHDEYRNAQSRMKRHQPTTAGMEGLRELEGLITCSAINCLKPEMHEARILAATTPGTTTTLFETPAEVVTCIYRCINPITFGLPCQYIMLKYVLSSVSLPRHLIHPWWFLDPHEACSTHPSYRSTTQ